MKEIIDNLFEILLEKYKEVIYDLNNGQPLTESSIYEIWEMLHLIDCIRYGELNNNDINKILRFNGKEIITSY